MQEPLDLIVIGTGTGGSGPAYRCRRAGWRVAVVDELPYGGTCALRGCDPKKVLVGAAELTDWHGRMQGRGVSGDAHISWPELIQFKRTFTDPVPADREKAFQEAGIATYHGPARFVSPERLSVDGQVLEARHFVVAAGAKPRHLGIPGEEYLLTSTGFLELDQLPPRIAFLGAGYISFEFAHISRRAGAQATIIGRGKPLQHFEQDLVTRLAEHTRSLGIAVQGDAEVTAIEKRVGSDCVRVHSQGRMETVEADAVVHGGGRVPNTEGLDLRAANVATVRQRSRKVGDLGKLTSGFVASDVGPRGLGQKPGMHLGASGQARRVRNSWEESRDELWQLFSTEGNSTSGSRFGKEHGPKGGKELIECLRADAARKSRQPCLSHRAALTTHSRSRRSGCAFSASAGRSLDQSLAFLVSYQAVSAPSRVMASASGTGAGARVRQRNQAMGFMTRPEGFAAA